MIHRCRPDIDAQLLCDEARRALSARRQPLGRLAAVGPRRLFATPSARDAIRWVLERVGIGRGDEVALPALICPAVADVVLSVGARPVVFGVSRRDFMPSVEACAAALSPATRAVIVPHLYGIPADLAGFRALCEAHGLLLLEDCAACAPGQDSGVDVGTTGECAVYSFKYDKPLALGWGGALSLSPAMLERVGPPEFAPASEREERLIAAAFALQHCLTDGGQDHADSVAMSQVLDALLESDALGDAALCLLQSRMAADDLAAWWRSCAPAARAASWGGYWVRARRCLERAASAAFARLHLAHPGTGFGLHLDAAARLRGKRLPEGGACEHLLALQQRALDDAGAHRAAIAGIYLSGLDREGLLVPEPSNPPSLWVRLPVALRRGRQRREELCGRLRRALGVEVGPYNWSLPVHLVPRLRGRVRVGPAVADTERLVEGLVNLPVHAQVTEDLAWRLVDALNRWAPARGPAPMPVACLPAQPPSSPSPAHTERMS